LDIYSLLRQDHQRVKELFEQIEATEPNGGGKRETVFGAIKKELMVHKEAEESTFYAALSVLPEMSDRIEEAMEEHVDVEELLQELDETDTGSDAFMAQLAELREEVEHHVSEEENEIFPRARELLTEEQADSLAREMQTQKQRLEASS
jgi:hemerythrin superfamily protein